MEEYTASTRRIVTAALELFDRIVDRSLLVRRFYLTATRVADERSAPDKKAFEQMDLFTDYAASQERKAEESAELEREKKVHLEEGATAKERNNMIGGHRSGEV